MRESVYKCDGCNTPMPATLDISLYYGADCAGVFHVCNSLCIEKLVKKMAAALKGKIK